MRFISDTTKVDKIAYKDGLKVFCIGLPLCATTSLQSVMENYFNYPPFMHMANVIPSVRMIKLCTAAQDEEDKTKRQKILHEIFDGYASSADYPGNMFVEDLIEMYPDAKLILNYPKSSAAWTKSASDTIEYFSGMP